MHTHLQMRKISLQRGIRNTTLDPLGRGGRVAGVTDGKETGLVYPFVTPKVGVTGIHYIFKICT